MLNMIQCISNNKKTMSYKKNNKSSPLKPCSNCTFSILSKEGTFIKSICKDCWELYDFFTVPCNHKETYTVITDKGKKIACQKDFDSFFRQSNEQIEKIFKRMREAKGECSTTEEDDTDDEDTITTTSFINGEKIEIKFKIIS